MGGAVIQRLRAAIAEFRQDGPLMEQALAALGLTAVIMLSITLLRMDGGYVFVAPQQSQAERTSSPPAAARAANPALWAEAIAACMNGGRFVWTDPHTGFDYAAKCNVVQLGRIPK